MFQPVNKLQFKISFIEVIKSKYAQGILIYYREVQLMSNVGNELVKQK